MHTNLEIVNRGLGKKVAYQGWPDFYVLFPHDPFRPNICGMVRYEAHIQILARNDFL